MDAAIAAGMVPPDCTASSTLSATLELPAAVAAASATATLALGVDTAKGTLMAAAACRRRPVTAAGAPEMLTTHAAGKPWSRTSAACTMLVSAAPPGVPKAKASGGEDVVSESVTSMAAGAAGAGAGAASPGSE